MRSWYSQRTSRGMRIMRPPTTNPNLSISRILVIDPKLKDSSGGPMTFSVELKKPMRADTEAEINLLLQLASLPIELYNSLQRLKENKSESGNSEGNDIP